MKEVDVKVDFCVVGGGLAGLCAAVAAARHGAKVALMQDRPVLGGNASSEIRMWVCGCHGENLRETGIIEEIQLENLHRNLCPNYSIWDSVLYEKARFQPNLTLLLNCPCGAVDTENGRIRRIHGRQMTTEIEYTVEAELFADCSGDGFLGAMAGADFAIGREAGDAFGEPIERRVPDRTTMGMSCLIQARETDSPKPFVPPRWANVYETDERINRGHELTGWQNFWWLELGGDRDSIHDTEEIRDELLKLAFGVWDHIKNRGDHGADNWTLEWLGFLPGKRESRRFVGDAVLRLNDLDPACPAPDVTDTVAYGGWPIDDHPPKGFHFNGPATTFGPSRTPYPIPYRCLYSRNIANLFFAGRNISCSHMAMSSTRVMATCALMGQAVGTAAALATEHGLTPRQVGQTRIAALQQALMEDDCYLPGVLRQIGALTARATLSASSGDPAPLRNGIDRPVGAVLNAWTAGRGDHVEFAFPEPVSVAKIRLVFDSDCKQRGMSMPALYTRDLPLRQPPRTLVSDFRVQARHPDGTWRTLAEVKGNYQRLVRLDIPTVTTAIRIVIDKTHGNETVNVYAADIG
jgi:hypothetical protein